MWQASGVLNGFLSKDEKRMICRCTRDKRGFTMLEMLVTVIVLGILTGTAWWMLGGTVHVGSLDAAKTRTGRAMMEAYSIAQNEEIQVDLTFYSDTNSNPAIRNTYEILRGTAPAVPMRPPTGVTYYSPPPSGVTDYYCRLTDDGSKPLISSEQSMRFVPSGATTKCQYVTGNGTVTINYQGKTATVTVNQEGRVTF